MVRGNPASWVWDETKIEPREEDMWLGFVWEDLQIRLWFRSEMVGTVERVFLPREAGPFPPFPAGVERERHPIRHVTWTDNTFLSNAQVASQLICQTHFPIP